MAFDDWKGITIKVIGIGGAGSNAVDRMIHMGIPGVDFIAANSDVQALAHSEAAHKIRLGRDVTRAMGTGGDPAIGARAAYESREEIARALRGADMVFIAAGMGGGTGTGAAPIVAQIARAAEALTIAVVSTPFTFEGNKRLAIAKQGIAGLRKEVDTLIAVPNDRLLEIVDKRISLDIAFRIADEALRQGVQAISELVTRPGLINLDFADVRTVMSKTGSALISIGHGEGQHKAVEAARMALRSPLLNVDSIHGTQGLLVNITGGEDLTLAEVNQAMALIFQAAAPQAEVLFGAVIDPQMQQRAEITLIATGVGARAQREAAQVQAQPRPQETPATQAAPEPTVIETPSLQAQDRPVPLAEILGDELAIPAFMRSRKRVRMEEFAGV